MTRVTIKKYEITYDKAFITELKRISIYFIERLKNTKGSYKIIENVMGKIKILEQFPFIGKIIWKTKNFEYRKFIIKNYIIIYKINLKEKEINILHIYNQKQKVKNKKEYSQV